MGGYTHAISKEFIADVSDYYSALIVVPEEVKSHECVNVLNYFGFPFTLEEDNIVRTNKKKEMGFDDNDEYPILIIDSSKEEIPCMDLIALDGIMNGLKSKDFIPDYLSHSAKEK